MQVNSVSSGSFGQVSQREILERFAGLEDNQLKKMANQIAGEKVNDKRHKRINNMLYYSLPIAAGVAAVVANPAKAGKIYNKAGELISTLSPRFDRLQNFATTALKWAGTFAFIDVLFAGKRKLNKESEAVRDFDRKHPVVATLVTVGAAIGAVILGGKAVSKVLPKLTSKINIDKVAKLFSKIDNALVNNKALNTLSNGLKKVPSAIKSFAKGTLQFSPMLLLFAQISHSLNHANVKAECAGNTYKELKASRNQAQEIMAQLDNIDKDKNLEQPEDVE